MSHKFTLTFVLQLAVVYITAASWPWHHQTSDFHPSTRLFYKNPRNAPSDLCPRDDIQAQQQGRTCLRKCTSDEDCKSKRKKCLCDGACGLSCIKPEKECGDPEPSAELGEVHITGKMFGAKAVYSCPEGFRVIGMEKRVCQADGTWSGTAPACKKNIYCTQPPTIDHARHNAPLEQTTFDLDTSLQYQCFPGYTTKGFARTKCFFYNGTAKWFGPDITCEPRSCGEPAEILNGRREGLCHHFTCKVTYVCQPGFELLGRAEHLCQADGSWSPKDLPTCVPVQCPIPENPGHGKAVYSAVSFNSIVSYECKYGYMLVGEGTRRCGPNKKWTGVEPLCKEINCGAPGILQNGWLEGTRTTLHAVVLFHCLPGMTFEGSSDRSVCQLDGTWSHVMPKCNEINCGSPGHLHNGWLENIEGGTALGASVIFRCYDNMTLVGHSSSLCHIDGKWRYPLPQCLAPCTVPEVAFGNATTRPEPSQSETNDTTTTAKPITPTVLLPGTTITHGKTIGVQCEKQYEPTHNITPSTCSNGTWTHAPRCQPARCKHLPKTIRHGMVIAPKTEHGMKARYTCRDGYNLVGNNVTECQYGQWIGDPPTCNQTYCKFPGNIPDGRVLLVGNMGLYDYRNYVTKVANNRQITFVCEKGFVLSEGPEGKTCIRGEWSPKTEPPRCNPSHHPSFRWTRSVRRRRAIKTGGSSIVRNKAGGGGGGSAGTRRSSKRRKQYGDADDYEQSALVCDSLEDDPYIQTELIQPGDDHNETFSSGAIIKISCTPGFGVNLPNETSKCILGDWKPKIPKCDALPCKVPYITHGSFHEGSKGLYFQEQIKHQKIIELRCSKGYTLVGPNELPCWYGEWDVADPPECVPVQCVLPPIENGNYINNYGPGLAVPHGTEVDFVCGGDHRKIVSGPSRCHLGEWLPQKPLCVHPSIALNSPFPTDADSDHHDKKRKHSKDGGSRVTLLSLSKRPCGLPPKEKGAIVYAEGKPVDFDYDSRFPDSTEALYKCAVLKSKTRNRWKMTCEDGNWNIGTQIVSACDGDVPPGTLQALLRLINSNCLQKKVEPNVVTFYQNQEVVKELEFPSETMLISRCVDIGKFEMKGGTRRKCVSGQWLGVTPKCEGLSQYNDYALDRPPTILFRYVNGSIVQTNDGKLVVYPGTTLHMECIWIRKFGSPRWETATSNLKEYPVGWTDGIEGREPSLEYRLTIEDAQVEDSGVYTCITPARHSHQINIQIESTECSPLPAHSDLEYSTTDTLLGTQVTFTCRSGNAVVGAQVLVCTAAGNWSAPLPRCENVECADISLLPAMAPLAYSSLTKNGTLKRNETAPPKITVLGRHVGDKAQFSCPQGFILQGAAEAVCQHTGDWSAMPLCKEVECSEPDVPDNAFTTGTAPFKAGDFVQFECNQGYMLEGTQSILVCQDSGIWSRTSPGLKCVQACTYPGTIIGGTISEVRFYYRIQETVTFDCIDGYELSGSRMLHCQRNGKWSTSTPICVPIDKSNKEIEYNSTKP